MFLCLFISNSCDFNVRPSLSTVTQLNVQKCLLCLLRTTFFPQNQCVVVMAFVVSLCDHTLKQAARPFSRKQTARMAAHSFSNTKDFSVFECLRTLFKKLSYLFFPKQTSSETTTSPRVFQPSLQPCWKRTWRWPSRWWLWETVPSESRVWSRDTARASSPRITRRPLASTSWKGK